LAESDKISTNEMDIFSALSSRSASIVEQQLALLFLSKYLQKHHGKNTIILLDEYDTPFHAAYTSSTPYHEVSVTL